MSSIMQQVQELQAFCRTCPSLQEVTACWHTMGFTLVFQMPACIPSSSSAVAPLPAQFHYERPDGVSIIYLAGQDSGNEEGGRLPPHASRWWAYAGVDPDVFSRVTHALAVKWSCTWRPLTQTCQDVA
jgi:hypothetical protein